MYNRIRSYLKKVFWHNLFVGTAFQILDIPEYACGLQRSPALSLNQNPVFEMASTVAHCKYAAKGGHSMRPGARQNGGINCLKLGACVH